MPNRKVTDFSELTSGINLGSFLHIIDIDEIAVDNKNKKITLTNLASALPLASPVTTKGDIFISDGIDTRLPVGVDGQILSANSATSEGLQWINPPATSPLTTKGDIYTFTTVNARLPIGSDGQVIVANSATPSGLEWVTGSFGEDYIDINSAGTLPSATGTDSIVIGPGSSAAGTGGIVIGEGAGGSSAPAVIAVGDGANSSGDNSVAIGTGAVSGNTGSIAIGEASTVIGVGAIAIGPNTSAPQTDALAIGDTAVANAASAIQLGNGTNADAQTLQFRANRLANNEGLYTSFNAPVNYTPVDNDNVTSHFEALDTALGNFFGGYAAPFGDALASNFVITHNLGTRDVTVSVYQNSAPYDEVSPLVSHTSDNTITLDFGMEVPTSNQYRVFVSTGGVTIAGGAGSQNLNADIGNGAASSFNIVHNFNTRLILVSVVRNIAPFDVVTPFITYDTLNDITVDFGMEVPATNEYKVLIKVL